MSSFRKAADAATRIEVPEMLRVPEGQRALAALEGKFIRAADDPVLFVETVFRDNTGRQVRCGTIHKSWQAHIDYCWAHGKHAVILAAFGHGKTVQIVIGRTLYEIGRNPNLRCKIVSSVDNPNAVERVAAAAKVIRGNPYYRKVFPKVLPSKISSWSAHRFFVERDPSIDSIDATLEARGIFSAGIGARADLLVFDDPVDQKNAIDQPSLRQKVIDNFENVWLSRLEPTGRVIYIGCVNRDSFVLTSNGLCRIGSLCPSGEGHRVLSKIIIPVFGRWGYKDTEAFWNNGFSATRVMTLENGQRLEGTMIHPVLKMGDDGVPYWERMKNLKCGDFVAVYSGAGFGNEHEVEIGHVVKRRQKALRAMPFPDVMTEELAYLVGLWTAEGSSDKKGRVGITTLEPSLREWLLSRPFGMKFVVPKRNPWTLVVNCRRFHDIVEYLGGKMAKSPFKVVPDKIAGAKREVVRAFLRGLFDGDGYAYADNRGSSICVGLGMTSENIVRDVQTLLLHFGIVATLHKEGIAKPSVLIPNGGNHHLWRLKILGAEAVRFFKEVGFSLPRKQGVFGHYQKCPLGSRWRDVPKQRELLLSLKREMGRSHSGKMRGNFYGTVSQERISRKVLTRAAQWFGSHGVAGSLITSLRRNIEEENLVWLKVVDLKKSRAATCDFVIPDGHSFLSNGVVSHNTPWHEGDVSAHIIRQAHSPNTRWCVLKEAIADDMSGIEVDVYGADDDYEEWTGFNTGTKLPLWADRWGVQQLTNKRMEGERAYQRGFRLIALSDEEMVFKSFPTDKVWKDYDITDRSVIDPSWPRVFGIDLSSDKRPGTAIFCAAMDPATMRRFPLEIRYGRWTSPETARMIGDMDRIYNPRLIVIENNAYQNSLIEWIQQSPEQYRFAWKLMPFTTGKQKADPQFGLPGLEVEFSAGAWWVSKKLMKGHPGFCKCGFCLWYREMSKYPLSESTDLLMSSWFCREGIVRLGGQVRHVTFGNLTAR